MCLYIVIYIQVSMYYMGLYIGSLYSHLYYIYIWYAQSTDSDHPRILLTKPRIRALRNNPRITHANLGSEDLLCKPRIRGCYCANLGSARNHLGSRNQTSAIHGNKPTIDRARKAARPSTATWVRCSGWPSCFACAIDRGFFFAADGRTALRVRSIVASLMRMAELLCVRDRSLFCYRGWPRFGCVLLRMAVVWLCDPRRLRACGSEVFAAKSCFACAIDRGFVAADGRGLAA